MTKIDGLGKLLIGVDTKGYLTTVESSVAAQLVLRLMEMVESSGGVCLRTLFVSVATETFPQNVDICRRAIWKQSPMLGCSATQDGCMIYYIFSAL